MNNDDMQKAVGTMQDALANLRARVEALEKVSAPPASTTFRVVSKGEDDPLASGETHPDLLKAVRALA